MGQKDLTQKDLECYTDVFADVINALMYDGEKVLQDENLQPAPTETIYHSKVSIPALVEPPVRSLRATIPAA